MDSPPLYQLSYPGVVSEVYGASQSCASRSSGRVRVAALAWASVQECTLTNGQATRVIVVVITGPIASGKSTLGRAVAVELAARGFASAVIDLDLVYEILDPSRGPKDDEARWREARRLAGTIAARLERDRSAVVVEGEFATEVQRSDLCAELPHDWSASFVTLTVDFDEALRRAMVDPTRGISKDRDFLAAHYRAMADTRETNGDFVLDTGGVSVSLAARSIVDWLLPASE
jgi:predicted kinase